ncbi:MAG: hypothetical protein EAZ09_01895 [Oscillatoriales cyanobacterium]|nr:MAG: hypothetical protein EAZ09_01895 [Oscillatoriales cyanobacterium]
MVTSRTRRSPLTPLKKGGTRVVKVLLKNEGTKAVKVPLLKGDLGGSKLNCHLHLLALKP